MLEHEKLEDTAGHLELENQDLAAHTYTGQGMRAKHQSKIVHQKDSYSENADEQIFQVSLVNRLEREYQVEIDRLKRAKIMNTGLIKLHERNLGSLYEENDTILAKFEELCQKEKSSLQEADDAKEKCAGLRGDLERTKDIQSTLEKELERQQAALESIRSRKAQEQYAIAQFTGSLAKAQEGGLFSEAKTWHYNRKLKNHRGALEKLEEQSAHYGQLIDRYTIRKDLTKRQVDAMQRQIEVLTEREVTSRKAATEFGRLATEISNTAAIRFTEGYAGGQGKNYMHAYGLRKATEQIEADIAKNEEEKSNVERQVQNAEIHDMSQKGYGKTIRAISMNGKMYYDNTQLIEDGQGGAHVEDSDFVAKKIEQSEEKIFLEEEKIASQLKKRPIFQYMNSDTLMEYIEYDEHAGDFLFRHRQQQNPQGTSGQAIQPTLEDLVGLGLTDDVAFQGNKKAIPKKNAKENIKAAWKAIEFIRNPIAKAIGIQDILDAVKADKTNNHTAVGNHAFYAGSTLAYLMSVGAGSVLFNPMKNAGLGASFNNLGDSMKLLNFELLGKANVSLASGLGAALQIGKGAYRATQEFSLASKQTEYGDVVKKKGFQRFGRIMDNTATEGRVRGLENISNAAAGGLSLALSLSGIGGLLVTGASASMNALVKLIGGAIIRSKNNKAILNSPHVLGGLQYDKKIIDEDHFNALFAEVTGLNEPDDLAATLKVVDGIDLHRGLRRSVLVPNPELERTMAQMGYPDPMTYDKITLKDLHTKVGFKKDWRKTLRNAIEIKGFDYNTLGTKFVKGITFQKYQYANKKRLSSNEMAAQRRKKLEKKAKKK